MILLDVDVRIAAHGLHQSSLDLSSRVVGMVEDTELRVSSLTVQIEAAVFLAVEVHSPLHQFINLLRCIPYHLLHSFHIIDVVTGYHSVFDMLIEIVYLEIRHRCHSSLGEVCIRLIERCFADQAYLAFVFSCYL